MTDLWNKSFTDVLDDIASDRPTPGGGAAAAAAALIGLSLVRMAFKVTLKSRDITGVDRLNVAENLVATLSELLKAEGLEDIKVFDAYMAAIKMPKETPDAVERRNQALDKAVLDAVTVPLKAATHAVDALEVAQNHQGLVKDSIISDLLSGCHILQACIVALLFNVDVNLQSKRLADKKAKFFDVKAALLRRTQDLMQSIDHAAMQAGFVTRT